MNRRVASRQSAAQTRFSRVTLDHGLGLDEMAREHASRRNTHVVTLLTYLATLKSRQTIAPQMIAEHAARWQNVRARQTPRPQGHFELDWDPARGYGRDEAAHCLPCSLDYGNRDISTLGANIHEERVLRGPFADVSPLPAVYNDADQRSEDSGLRRTLERVARMVVSEQETGADVDFSLIRRIYHHEWVPQTTATFQRVKVEIRPLWASERLRSLKVKQNRQTGLSPEHLQSDTAGAFYQNMDQILRHYEEITSKRTPLNLQTFQLQTHVSELETASSRACDRRWPRRLELLPS